MPQSPIRQETGNEYPVAARALAGRAGIVAGRDTALRPGLPAPADGQSEPGDRRPAQQRQLPDEEKTVRPGLLQRPRDAELGKLAVTQGRPGPRAAEAVSSRYNFAALLPADQAGRVHRLRLRPRPPLSAQRPGR